MKKIIMFSALAVGIGLSGFVLLSNQASAQTNTQGLGFGRGWNRTANQTQSGFGKMGNLDVKAKALNMTQEELQAQLQSGKTLADILQDKNITQEQFRQNMDTKMKANLQDLVAKGTITQSQADARLQFMEQRQSSNKASGVDCPMGGWR